MPVSHLALIVSNLAAATSFYEKALRPLGYKYCGWQGDAIGFGVHDAEFFLCEARDGQRVTPTHIAFSADNRLIVRECYTAALNADGHPSGPPQYRNNDCSCFNAAVEDYDGNTIEFIFREPCQTKAHQSERAPSEYRATPGSQNGESRNYVDTVASYANKAQSTAHTALDFASSASQSFKKASGPSPGITRSSTEPVMSSNNAGGKAIVGTLLGAAAGAAFAYAMVSSERSNAADEAKFAGSMRSRSNRTTSAEGKSPAPRSISNRSRTRPSRVTRPQIEAPPYYDEPYTSSIRPPLSRSRTYDAIEYRPRSNSVGRSQRFSMKRASTMPTELDGDHRHEQTSARYSSRRRSLDDSRSSRHDSAVSTHSHRTRRSSFSKTSTAKPSKRGTQYESAANVPLPSSRATSYHTIGDSTPRASKSRSYASAAHVPLPDSRAPSYLSGASVPIPESEYRGGYTDVVEEWDGINDAESVVPDDSISCVDFSQLRKKSSAGSRGSKHGSSKSSRRGSKRSEADSERTIRPAKVNGSKHSVRTLPVRPKEDRGSRNGRRSTATYA